MLRPQEEKQVLDNITNLIGIHPHSNHCVPKLSVDLTDVSSLVILTSMLCNA